MNARNANRFRPMLEAFEDRTVPTVLTPVIDVYSLGNATEGGSGGFMLTRTVNTSGVLMVNYTIGGTSDNADHGLGTSGTVMFADGVGTSTFIFTATDDSDSEPTETLVLTLTSSTDYTIGTANIATMNLLDNDAQYVSVANLSDATEGGNAGALGFTRIGDLSSPLTVNYTVSGTATSGDFVALAGTVTFAANSATADVSVTGIDDVNYDPAETIVVTVTSGTGYSVGSTYIATITITDNEGTPVYWIGGYGASWSVGSNWSNNAVPDETTAVYFDGTLSSSVPVYSNYGVTIPATTLGELHFVNGYTGTVTLANNLTVGKLELASADATLDQPAVDTGAGIYGSDITVTAAMLWTGGTINSTANLANLTITGTGTWATFAPDSAGTVDLGSNITLASGANAMMRAGTINATTSDLTFNVLDSCSFIADPGTGSFATITSLFSTNFQISSSASWTLNSGTWTFPGVVRNQGTFTLLSDTIALLVGNIAPDPNDPDTFYSYLQSSGATYLYGSSILLTGEGRGVKIADGILATIGTGSATISTKELLVTGGDIYIAYSFRGTNRMRDSVRVSHHQ